MNGVSNVTYESQLSKMMEILFAFMPIFFLCVSVFTFVDIIIGQFLFLRLSASFPSAEPDSVMCMRHSSTRAQTVQSWQKRHNHKWIERNAVRKL